MPQKKGGTRPDPRKEVEFISVRSPRSSRVGRPAPEPGRWVAWGIFALVTLIFFGPHLLGSAFLWEDFTEQYLPFQAFAARSLMEGTFPFWNPYTFAGMPFFADLQNGLLYPGHLLMYLFSGGSLSVWLAQAIIILHYLVAMIGMWSLAGTLRIGGWGRIFAGIGYGLSGIMVAHMIHPNMIFHMAFFPLILSLYWHGLRDRSMLPTLLSGLLLGLVMLSGHPQTALYIIVFLVLTTLFEVVRDLRGTDPERKRSLVPALGTSLAAMILAGGIFAVQYLPSQELAEMSQRAEMTYEASTDGALETRQLLTLIAPEYFGVMSADPPEDLPFWLRGGGDVYYFWETTIFVGIVTLLLAILALGGGGTRGSEWFLVGAGMLGLLYGLGDNFILHPILGRLPGFDTFRIPARMSLYFALAMPLLAGAGLDRLIRGLLDPAKGRRTVLIGGGIILLIALLLVTGGLDGALGVPPQIADAVTSSAVPGLLITMIAVGILWFALQGKIPAAGTAVILTLLLAVELFTFGIGQNQSSVNPEDRFETVDAQFADFRVDPPEKIFRVQMRGIGNYGGAMLTLRNQGPWSRFMLIEGYNPLVLQRAYPRTDDFEEMLSLLNVTYAVDVDSATGAPLGYRSRPTTYGHARMIYDAEIVAPSEAENAMNTAGIDFGSTALLEEDPGIPLNGGGQGSARIVAYSAEEIVVETGSSTPGLLLLSEVWYPAWKAEVDGVATEVLRANYSLRAVPVPAGEHTVRFTYDSDAFSTGFWITVISLLLLLGGILFLLLKRRRTGAEVSATEEGTDGNS